jgi:hypothetical protein
MNISLARPRLGDSHFATLVRKVVILVLRLLLFKGDNIPIINLIVIPGSR